ncbi:MAG: hypothetical protein WAV16_04415 [Candidatus Moraniibacteriota bacterium]
MPQEQMPSLEELAKLAKATAPKEEVELGGQNSLKNIQENQSDKMDELDENSGELEEGMQDEEDHSDLKV